MLAKTHRCRCSECCLTTPPAQRIVEDAENIYNAIGVAVDDVVDVLSACESKEVLATVLSMLLSKNSRRELYDLFIPLIERVIKELP